MVLLPSGTFSSGFIGMALSYGLSLNMSFVMSIQNQCTLANYIISVERLNQYMHIPSEAPEVIEENRAPVNWPTVGEVEIQDLKRVTQDFESRFTTTIKNLTAHVLFLESQGVAGSMSLREVSDASSGQQASKENE